MTTGFEAATSVHAGGDLAPCQSQESRHSRRLRATTLIRSPIDIKNTAAKA